jgi:hypothetical protein
MHLSGLRSGVAGHFGTTRLASPAQNCARNALDFSNWKEFSEKFRIRKTFRIGKSSQKSPSNHPLNSRLFRAQRSTVFDRAFFAR